MVVVAQFACPTNYVCGNGTQISGSGSTVLHLAEGIYATNCMAKCVHPNTVLKIKNSFSILSRRGFF